MTTQKDNAVDAMQDFFPNGGRDWDAINAMYEAIAAGKIPGVVTGEKVAELQQRLQQSALADVMTERQRQIDAEGWTPQHDDEHTGGEIADAAACYARLGSGWSVWGVLRWWPWEKDWLKPSEPRRSLVKAGALILAEIERLDRAAAKVEGE